MGDELRYLYAVCRPFESPLQAELRGVAGAPVRSLPHGDLVAVVSAVPRRAFADAELRTGHDFAGTPLPGAREPGAPRRHLPQGAEDRASLARSHRSVIDALATVACPVPLPFGTVLSDDSAVRALLEADAERLRAALDRLEGRVEWRVTARLTDGDGQLYERTPSGTSRAAAEIRERLHTQLTRHAEASRVSPPGTDPATDPAPEPERDPAGSVFDASYLVPRRSCEAFVELVDRAASQLPGIQLDLNGPRAGYSFADGPIGAPGTPVAVAEGPVPVADG